MKGVGDSFCSVRILGRLAYICLPQACTTQCKDSAVFKGCYWIDGNYPFLAAVV